MDRVGRKADHGILQSRLEIQDARRPAGTRWRMHWTTCSGSLALSPCAQAGAGRHRRGGRGLLRYRAARGINAALRCLGCSREAALAVYLVQTIVLGVVGSLLGSVLGVVLHLGTLLFFPR